MKFHDETRANVKELAEKILKKEPESFVAKSILSACEADTILECGINFYFGYLHCLIDEREKTADKSEIEIYEKMMSELCDL